MQLKSKVLIFASVITLLALTGIQSYLIYNTYELKKKAFVVDAKAEVGKVYRTPTIDSLMWTYRYHFLDKIQEYKSNKISKEAVIDSLKKKTSAINGRFLELYNEGMSGNSLQSEIKFRQMVSHISMVDNLGKKDNFLNEAKKDSIFLFGEDYRATDGVRINNATWTQEHEYVLDGVSIPYFLEFKTHIFIDVLDENKIMLKELSGILIAAVLLFIFVVSLLYYSIQNLFKQKRLADIKTDFINNITHELKTPLSTLSLATETLTGSFVENDTILAKETVQIINRQNVRLQKLIDQVVESSLGYREIQLSNEEFNCSIFLNELINDYELPLNSSVVISKKIDNTGILMVADKFFLGTAIINLLNNAIKYGGTELEISYTVDTKKDAHIINIKDNGIGISEKYQKHIFHKFYRVSEKDTHNYKGLGLGLYYTSQIIKAHNGTITVHSSINNGATFSIQIPLAQ
ncbi:sensor histidine kinase [Ulvibacter litoralis]|uniref:histidine kinase n=1 Tax=Ulvibacter litoralis TaxID=227084 RepID=A0A1G7FPF5_9FLAO|nr:HAMP domain-containing sensor histidine kinase [Ulvibacter litoralis]GHC50283.1 two-component sensor histidine kinase [Ulvibacter litoralis]SDE77754.1 His Kinase A (phospho-acceptor) domain-containing protein [Ulvibacter litoralis]